MGGVFCSKAVWLLKAANDRAEDVTDYRAKQQQDGDNDDGHQDQNKSVLYEALTFFTR